MVFILVLMVAGVIAIIAFPVVRWRGQTGTVLDDSEDTQSSLLWQKESSYAAIRELDFDYHTGKISDDDYKELYGSLKADALRAIKAIELIESANKKELDDAIEEEIKERQGLLMKSHEEQGERTAEACPVCGARVSPEDRFCSSCGGQFEWSCGECGSTNPSGAGFCSNCGARALKFCSMCGEKVNTEAKFCSSCGEALF